MFLENHDRLFRQWKLHECGEIIFFNTKVNAGFKHSMHLENVVPVHHLGIPVAKHINKFSWLELQLCWLQIYSFKNKRNYNILNLT